ncbi:MAG: glycosyltransferase [Bacteroidales bacterium]|jgi:glycosyltransferase involved in cell wall biosynthesis|nr:glycosyltransferase [Bacteroidales bacterium]
MLPVSVSVIMPVYNTEKYVGEAIESILNQEFADFEFIIIDDGSTDNSLQVIQSYNDPRIRLITNNSNIGNYPSRNRAMQLAQGKYICVMDADDIAMPNRLLTQFNFMEFNPDYVALGSFAFVLHANGSTTQGIRTFGEDNCKIRLLQTNISYHPSMILRRETLVEYNIKYDEQYIYAADFDLMVQLSKVGIVNNIPSFLLYYRIHSEQISISKYKEQQIYADRIRLGQLQKFGFNPTPQESELHLKLMTQKPLKDYEIVNAEKWTDKLVEQNRKYSLFNHKLFTHFLKNEIMAFYLSKN